MDTPPPRVCAPAAHLGAGPQCGPLGPDEDILEVQLHVRLDAHGAVRGRRGYGSRGTRTNGCLTRRHARRWRHRRQCVAAPPCCLWALRAGAAAGWARGRCAGVATLCWPASLRASPHSRPGQDRGHAAPGTARVRGYLRGQDRAQQVGGRGDPPRRHSPPFSRLPAPCLTTATPPGRSATDTLWKHLGAVSCRRTGPSTDQWVQWTLPLLCFDDALSAPAPCDFAPAFGRGFHVIVIRRSRGLPTSPARVDCGRFRGCASACPRVLSPAGLGQDCVCGQGEDAAVEHHRVAAHPGTHPAAAPTLPGFRWANVACVYWSVSVCECV